MAALYRQHVLKEAAPEPVIKIAGLGGKKKPAVQDVCTRSSSRHKVEGRR